MSYFFCRFFFFYELYEGKIWPFCHTRFVDAIPFGLNQVGERNRAWFPFGVSGPICVNAWQKQGVVFMRGHLAYSLLTRERSERNYSGSCIQPYFGLVSLYEKRAKFFLRRVHRRRKNNKRNETFSEMIFQSKQQKILKKIFYGYVRSTVIMVIVRDSSNFPIIIFPLLSSYFPTAARTYAWINCTIKDWLHGWLVGTSAHTKCICGYHKNPYASERSELHFVASFAFAICDF